MAKMNHVLLYSNYEAAIKSLTDAQVGRLTRAMLHLLNTGEELELKGPERVAWAFAADQIRRNMEKYDEVCERNRKNAQSYWDSRRKEGIDKLKSYTP